eukprot:6478699-Amphidinium_carterae.1
MQTDSFETVETDDVDLDTGMNVPIKAEDAGMRYVLCGSHRNTLVRADLVRAEHNDVHPGKLRPEDMSKKEILNMGSLGGMRRPWQAVVARPQMARTGRMIYNLIRELLVAEPLVMASVTDALLGRGDGPAEQFLDRVRRGIAESLEFDVECIGPSQGVYATDVHGKFVWRMASAM